MSDTRQSTLFRRFDAAEVRLCRILNRFGEQPVIRQCFRLVSRLGDGVFWYALMLALPLAYGQPGLHVALLMLLTGAAGTLLYRELKNRLVRQRPFVSYRIIHCGIPPLDEFSFPSGHTLHAAAFTTLMLWFFPAVGMALIPFALLVAASRVVLGLHYPTDVLVGAALGLALAGGSIVLASAWTGI